MGATASHRISYPELDDRAVARDNMQALATSVEVALNVQGAALNSHVKETVASAVAESTNKVLGQMHSDLQGLADRLSTETDRKLTGKLDTAEFQRYVASVPKTRPVGNNGGGGAVNVVDVGDGTILIG